jgi:hypothetical protein
MSLKHSKKRIEKKELDPHPLFSDVLSVQDMDRIKKVKEFVKSKESQSQSLELKNFTYFKDDPIKNTRCFNFFCEMEGLETGGVSEARVMTASQMRTEREEFSKAYQTWKSEEKLKNLQNSSKSYQYQTFESNELPIKRLPRFEDHSQNDPSDFLIKKLPFK